MCADVGTAIDERVAATFSVAMRATLGIPGVSLIHHYSYSFILCSVSCRHLLNEMAMSVKDRVRKPERCC
jgi:hypothetical protein